MRKLLDSLFHLRSLPYAVLLKLFRQLFNALLLLLQGIVLLLDQRLALAFHAVELLLELLHKFSILLFSCHRGFILLLELGVLHEKLGGFGLFLIKLLLCVLQLRLEIRVIRLQLFQLF